MAHEIQTVIGATILGITLIVVVLQERPGCSLWRVCCYPWIVGRFSFLCAGGPDCLKNDLNAPALSAPSRRRSADYRRRSRRPR